MALHRECQNCRNRAKSGSPYCGPCLEEHEAKVEARVRRGMERLALRQALVDLTSDQPVARSKGEIIQEIMDILLPRLDD